jgi:isopenicillin-N epimerase
MDLSPYFTASDNLAFLNAGSLSRTPLAALAAMDAIHRREQANPTEAVYLAPKRLWDAQKRLGAFLGADPDDLFLRSNITSALNDFLFSLDLAPGAEILVTGAEYGAVVNLCRVKAAQSGASVRVAALPLGPEVTAAQWVDAVVSAFTPSTRVLVLSHVLTGTGGTLPVQALAAKAREKGILTAVDGAHAVGALPLEIPALGVDFYGGNLHKWFMGPTGTAFGWVHPRLQGKLAWRFGGWASFGIPDSYRGFGGSAAAAARLFPGTMDTAPFQALGAVLDFWERHGAEAIRERQRSLRDLAARKAEALGWERVSPRDPARLGPLVSFRPPASWPKGSPVDLAQAIHDRCRVQFALPVVQGELLVRLSPGAYGTEKEVTDGMNRLQEFPRG